MRFGPDFDALIERFSPGQNSKIAIAVSGGGDSIALLRLAHEWAQRASRTLLAVTVDHGLRLEAKTEAEWVATLCRDLDIAHKSLVWSKPRASQKAARQARYELICREMQVHGVNALLVGHTADDVLETALIRRRRGVRDASIAGPTLASTAPVWPAGQGITMLRPLIFAQRTKIRAYLNGLEQSWLEDPSNENTEFERVRVRNGLARHQRLKMLAQNQIERLQTGRLEQDDAFGAALLRVTVRPDGLMEVADESVTDRLLAVLARCASGSNRDPRAEAVRDLRKTVIAPGDRQTLGGAWFQRTQRGYLIGRDPGAAKALCFDTLFDGRFKRSAESRLPAKKDQAFLVRETTPPSDDWTEIISDRLKHLALCHQTPRLNPVQT